MYSSSMNILSELGELVKISRGQDDGPLDRPHVWALEAFEEVIDVYCFGWFYQAIAEAHEDLEDVLEGVELGVLLLVLGEPLVLGGGALEVLEVDWEDELGIGDWDELEEQGGK